MNKNSLLPTGSSTLEHNAAHTLSTIEHIPIPIRDLYNPLTCPLDLLPYLAWSFSADYWDHNWPEETKRHAVANAFHVHKYKGTISAIRRVVEPLGYLIRISEWWQNGDPSGTFRLVIGVLDIGITDEMYKELERLINDAKPRSRHLIGLSISLESKGQFYAVATCYQGEELTIYPYLAETITVSGGTQSTAAIHQIDLMEVTSYE